MDQAFKWVQKQPWMAECPYYQGPSAFLDNDIIQVIELNSESIYIRQAEQEQYVDRDYVKRDQADGGTNVNSTETRGLANPKGNISLPYSRFIQPNVLYTLEYIKLALSSSRAYSRSGVDYNTYKHP